MRQIKTIAIKCDCKDTLNYKDLTEFQGELKARTEEDIAKAKTSILKYGMSFPFFVYKKGTKNYILDGHARKRVFAELEAEGYLIPELPVVYVECKNEKDAKQKLLRLNSQYGKMTKESVLEFAEDIDLNFDEIALPDSVIDFTDQSGEIAETEGDDEAPEVDEKSEPVSKRGEMYELGNSILMCGDSTNAEDVARLMGGEKCECLFSDPPYSMSDNLTGFVSDKMKEKLDDIVDFKPETMINTLESLDSKNIFIFTSKNLIPRYFEIFKDYKFNILVWCKDNPTPITNNTFLPDVEYLLYFYKSGRVWNNGLDVSVYKKYYNSNKLEGRKEAGNIHPTIKPLKIIEDKIQICSKKNGVVLDLFGGSGTTLIACEKNNRKARLMELDPHYCDVIRKRYTKWAKENGKPITSGCLE